MANSRPRDRVLYQILHKSLRRIRTTVHALMIAMLLAGLIPPPLMNGLATHVAEVTGSESVSELVEAAKLLPQASVALAQAPITGTIYRDFNGDGDLTTTGTVQDIGLADATVTAYDASGAMCGSAQSIADGTYSLTPTCTGPDFRLEFTGLPANYEPSGGGPGNGTSVQFVTDGANNVDFAVNVPCDYCQENPALVVPNMVPGITAASNTYGAMAQFPYNPDPDTLLTRVANNQFNADSIALANNDEIGSTWGVAYARSTSKIYAGAFLKRHVGLDHSNGNPLGKIWVMDRDAGNPIEFINLDPTINVGTIGDNTARGITGGRTSQSQDDAAYLLVGKAGLGDLDISTDERTLYAVSLNTKELVSIDIATKAISSVSIPDPGCVNGEWRPFAVSVYRDEIYLGGVCDGADDDASASNANLSATVYRYDGGTSFTTLLAFGLDFNKGGAAVVNTQWHPWTSTAHATAWEQPVLADIDFDVNGDMILGFLDRYGHQRGYGNFRYGTNGVNNGQINAGGDLMRACLNGLGQYEIESNGMCGGVTGFFSGGSVGIGGGEFYEDQFTIHPETSNGGVALLPGSGEVMHTAMDPLDGVGAAVYANAGGVSWVSNTTGDRLDGYHVFQDTSAGALQGIGKAHGVGDVELLCDPAPIEIGNRVWDDQDGDGVQGAGEPGLNGLTVTLQTPTGITTTTTMTDGNYLFSVEPNTLYTITVATPVGYSPTAANTDAVDGLPLSNNSTNDVRDSDALLVSGTPTIHYTTGGPGQNNHGLDFGFAQTVFEITKLMNTPPTVTVGSPISFTIRITNTGSISITNLPLTDDYDTTYLTYDTATDLTSPNPATDAANDGSIFWSNVIDFDADNHLAPNETLDIVVWFVAKAETAGSTAAECATGGNTYNKASAGGQESCVEVPIDPTEPKLLLGDLVWHDINGDETKDANEPGINGVVVYLFELDNTNNRLLSSLITTTTATVGGVAGTYEFNIPSAKSYEIEIADSNFGPDGPLAGYTFSADPMANPVGSSEQFQIELNATINNLDLDFALYCVFDLALDKKLTSANPIAPGDDVTFTISVYNQGAVTATNVTIADYIPTGFTLGGSGWNGGPTGTVTQTLGATLTPSGTVGAMTTVDILLTAGAALSGTYTNTAEILTYTSALVDLNGNSLPDVDSTPDSTNGNGPGESTDLEDDQINEDPDDGGDEDDHDPAAITIIPLVPTLAIKKRLNGTNPFMVNEAISYTIRITNTGDVMLTVIPLEDRYSDVFLTFDSASVTPNVGSGGGGGVLMWNDLTTALGNVAPTASISLVVTFTTQADTTLLQPVAPCTSNGHAPNIVDVDGASADSDGDDGTVDDIAVVQDTDDHDCAEVQILNPTAVQLAQRSMMQTPDGVLVRWSTVNESDFVGFYIWKSYGTDAQLRSSEMIVATSAGQSSGASYQWLDAGANLSRGDAYVLEIVKNDGSVEGTVIDVMSGGNIFLPFLVR